MKDKPSYEELERRYSALKRLLIDRGIEIPFNIEPYSAQEYQSRQRIPKVYWTERDKKAKWIEDSHKEEAYWAKEK